MVGVFLGYIWRSTEYIVGNKDGAYKCRTVRRRAEEVSYDSENVDLLTIKYDDFVMKGARTTPAVHMPDSKIAGPTMIPV